MRKLSSLIYAVILSILVSACGLLTIETPEVKVIEKSNVREQTNTQNSDLNEKGEVLKAETEEYIKEIIDAKSTEALKAIKGMNTEKLSELIHPDKGVRFSPYGYVDVENHLVFSAGKIKNLADDPSIYIWGNYDGIGDPIELTFNEYCKRFIYDVDFINAEQIGYNKALGMGNSLNNSTEVYKNSIIVEYHFPGFDPQYEGLDWRSLRLVFEKANDTWYLIGIIHDQWTI